MTTSLLSMLEVSDTLLITLDARARESMSRNPIIHDPKAVEMIEVIKKDIADSNNLIHKKIVNGKYRSKLATVVSLRSRQFDRYVCRFLEKHPGGTVINFGCGLDTRFQRIDNGKVTWFDIDFPEVIELRSRFITESDRHRFIAGSILDKDWIAIAKTGGPYCILAEGVFMYLTEADVKNLLLMIDRDLGGAELICEVSNRYWVDKMKTRYMKWKFKHQLGMAENAVFTFGIPHSRYFEQWSERYHFLDEWTYFDEKEQKLGWFNWFSSIEVFRKVQWTVRYQIGDLQQ